MQITTVLIFLFGITKSLQQCSIKSNKGTQVYFCNSIQDLEEQPNPEQLNVTIYNQTYPVTSTTHYETKPNVQIKLNDYGINKISSLTINLLKDLGRYFKSNYDVNELPSSIFMGLPIEHLKMEHNGIKSIQVGAFNEMSQLQTLSITNNKLSRIEKGIFNNLNVFTLSLSNNKISFIEKDALSNMKILLNLHLDGNNLVEFQPDLIMDNGGVLENLWLNNNSIGEIDRNLVRTLTNLRTLNLANNRISRIYSYTFENTLNLETLILSNNILLDFDGSALPNEGLTKLHKLFINNNRLSYITTTALEKIRNLKVGSFGGNPWHCPCFDALLTWISDHGVKQLCDEEYFSGLRPICVVNEESNICTYRVTQFSYYAYSEVNDAISSKKECKFY